MLRVGAMLRGIYRIDGYLSSGGFGNTYAATNVEFDEVVAIKEFFMRGVTQRDDNNSSVSVSNAENRDAFIEQRNKFKKEARRIRHLHNDHIVAVHDLFEENGTAYYVMDYIDGENLSQRLKRTGTPIAEDEAMSIFSQILDALETAHGATDTDGGKTGILHLDIKPANVMIDRQGNVKLIDFGASKQLSNKGGATTSTAISYTAGYAPREQMEQNIDKFGPWTDFYALGGTLYTLITNQKPALPSDIDDDHTTDKHLSLPMPAGTSDKMRDLIMWLMKTSRLERPESTAQIRHFLEGPVHNVQPRQPQAPASTPADSQDDVTVVQESEVNKHVTPPVVQRGTSVKHKSSPVKIILLSLVGLIAVFFAFIFSVVLSGSNDGPEDTAIVAEEVVAENNSVTDMVYQSVQGECVYTGPVDADNKPHGQGTAKFYENNKLARTYTGNWEHGNMQGQGTNVFANGQKFTGTFKDNYYDKGRLTLDEGGSYFEGTFHVVTKDGSKTAEWYNGEFFTADGKPDGKVVNGKELPS